MAVASIQKLINAHRDDYALAATEKQQQQVKVSQTSSLLAQLYERVRNAVDYQEEHLLRKRALKRIMLRIKSLEKGDSQKHAPAIVQEILWAQYMRGYGMPVAKLRVIAKIVRKYQLLVLGYKHTYRKLPAEATLNRLYAFAAVEIERLLVPHTAQDAIVDAQFQFLHARKLIPQSALDLQPAATQLFIASSRSLIKADDEMIGYKIFLLKHPFWGNPSKEQFLQLAQLLDTELIEIWEYLDYKLPKSIYKEVTKYAISFQILDKLIVNNLLNAEQVLANEEHTELEVREICEAEYAENRKRLHTTIVRSIIYIFITKVFLAVLIEIPYELIVLKHINWTTLAINIFFPAITLFFVANNFSIPNEKNTTQIMQMLRGILFPELYGNKALTVKVTKPNYSFILIFRIFYAILFLLVIGGIIYLLNLLQFNIAGILIFLVFFSTICFVAMRLRATAAELRVVDTRPGVLSPLVDMLSAPILLLGKKLSEGASDLNFFVVILDFLVEAPFKKIIKVFEDWTNYIRETREDIV